MIAALQYRQMKRQHELRMYRLDEDSEQQLRDFFASYEPPGWFQAQARLRAYASHEVWEAFEATRQADLEVWGFTGNGRCWPRTTGWRWNPAALEQQPMARR